MVMEKIQQKKKVNTKKKQTDTGFFFETNLSTLNSL